ncbi:MAG: caspase family protein [Bacteroidota bacterium]
MYSQRLKTGSALLFILFFTFTSLLAETRHIHVLRLLDNMNQNFTISEGCRSIDYGIEQEIQLMQFHLGITNVQYYDVAGINFSRDRLREVLDYELSYQERDIIILVYAGHGYREPQSQSRFPKLYFNNYAQAMEFDELRMALIQKNPSLLINMVVACNVTQIDHSVPPPYLEDGTPPPVATLTPKGTRAKEAYYRMFADQSGYTKVLDFLSADKDYYTFMTRDGGIFFSEILYAFQEVFSDRTLTTWQQVCRTISERTVYRSKERNMTQLPFCSYEIFLSQAAEVTVGNGIPPTVCVSNAKNLRRNQRKELKQLRRLHRQQMRSLPDRNREQRRLLSAQQRSERANMKLQHEQNYQRHLASCR